LSVQFDKVLLSEHMASAWKNLGLLTFVAFFRRIEC
jgi:hypothetical protein